MLKFILASIVMILVSIGIWFILANEFRRAATKYNEKKYKEFGNAMAWVIFYSALVIELVMTF